MSIEPVEALAARLNELRPSATIAVSRRGATIPREALDSFVASLGFQPIGKGWRQLDMDQATALLRRVLERDLAYDTTEMESEEAESIGVGTDLQSLADQRHSQSLQRAAAKKSR